MARADDRSDDGAIGNRTATSARGRSGAARRKEAGLWLTASHDFRQPAQSLELLAGAMADATGSAARERLAAMVREVASSLRAMVAGMTLVARLEAGEIAPVPAPVLVAEAVQAALAALGPAAALVEVHAISVIVQADALFLDAALRGALAHGLHHGERRMLRLECHEAGARVQISIFFQGKHPEGASECPAFVELETGQGALAVTALAPAMTKRLMAAMGGELLLVPPANGWSAVVLELPSVRTARQRRAKRGTTLVKTNGST